MNHIQFLLNNLNISQYKLADDLGVKQPTISRYVNGCVPSRKNAKKIIEYAAKNGIKITYNDLILL